MQLTQNGLSPKNIMTEHAAAMYSMYEHPVLPVAASDLPLPFLSVWVIPKTYREAADEIGMLQEHHPC